MQNRHPVRFQVSKLSPLYRSACSRTLRIAAKALGKTGTVEDVISLDDAVCHAGTLLGELRELGLRTSRCNPGDAAATERRRLRAETTVAFATLAEMREHRGQNAVADAIIASLEERVADAHRRLSAMRAANIRPDSLAA